MLLLVKQHLIDLLYFCTQQKWCHYTSPFTKKKKNQIMYPASCIISSTTYICLFCSVRYFVYSFIGGLFDFVSIIFLGGGWGIFCCKYVCYDMILGKKNSGFSILACLFERYSTPECEKGNWYSTSLVSLGQYIFVKNAPHVCFPTKPSLNKSNLFSLSIGIINKSSIPIREELLLLQKIYWNSLKEDIITILLFLVPPALKYTSHKQIKTFKWLVDVLKLYANEEVMWRWPIIDTCQTLTSFMW